MFHSRLEEMIRLGKDAFGFLYHATKRNDDGNRKSRNAFIYDEIPKIYWNALKM
jgi:hypothetical protein